jgi:hypothetical protein
MHPSLVPYVAALAAANLLALGALLLATRRGPRLRPAEARDAAPTLSDDPLEALVREVETAETASRFGAPGEEKLAEDIRRWRRQYAGGDPLPLAAGDGRGRRGTRT